MTDQKAECWAEMPALVTAVQAAGDAVGLPYVAAQADLGDPEPMSDSEGHPYAETTFHWIDPSYAYWRDRKLALQLAFLTAARLVAEPFYYSDGRLGTWRPTHLLDEVDCSQARNTPNFGEAIIAPVHLPRGLVGAVFWCSREPVGVETIFAEQAGHLHNLAVRLVATHNEARGRPRNATVPQTLTRREVQCLRWAAAGKTDGEIGIILSLSVSTVRFHLRNAAGKLGATGRAQSIQIAAGLGFVGARAA
ncbi:MULTISPECIES: helix-turn-helix transcriptional regulator [unclassified Sphingopyxis]|uniref:helix-turn-helix transcriptional regulator n=1 Tax=unclassified Sphingopyxis TaxID=2614943 RepID=UPI0006C3651A|nr:MULTISPECIES: helix-turn-helix transcriptional regulator [unclassified Sphingopyxis]USI78283.1 helix-turn-helix transcriptional regulator [Sphingopyxis sp. USTB-05]GAO79324.1 regulatory protein, LuxR [Sphingopyxis sp. C-1]